MLAHSQISIPSHDYLIDTLAVRSDLSMLNSSFMNPGIVKILHGADYDVLWLQRDCGLYLINMFDTGLAARALGLSSASLAFALKVEFF